MQRLQKEVMAELAQYQDLPVSSMTEVAKHNKDGDSWIVVSGIAYDVSKFHKYHPGGSRLLLRSAGQDMTKDFKMMHREGLLDKPNYRKLAVARLLTPEDPKTAKQIVAARMTEKWLPYCDHYWNDPRGTLKSPHFQPKHIAFQKKIRHFVNTELIPNAGIWDEQGSYPLELHEKGYKMGVFGAPWPKEYGGTPPSEGWDMFMDMIYLYEMGRCGSGGLMASWFFTANIGLPPVLNHGSRALRDRVCRNVITGKEIIALAVTEPWGGSDVANLRSVAVSDGSDYIINGEKKFITSGMTAQYLTAAIRTDPSKKGMNGISLILIETNMPGVTRRKIKTQGWWAGNTAYITFENVRVPKTNLIGKEGKGFKYIMENFNHERFAACVFAASSAHQLIQESIKFARVRHTFGKPLIEAQVIRHKLAEMSARVESHYAWCEQIAYMMQSGAPHIDVGSRIALCKVQGTKLVEFCAREASQILGGNSYARGGHGEFVERIYREVRVGAIGGGSEEILNDLGMRLAKL